MRKLRQDEIEERWSCYRGNTKHPIVAVLENIRSAYNVGSILRTSDAAALEKIIVCGITPTPDHKSVHKTALGSQDSVEWEQSHSAADVIRGFKQSGYRIAALEITDSPTPIQRLTVSDFPMCLVVGSEVRGVSDEALALCDVAVELPQFGDKHSLNAAVAFGVAAYAIVSRYHLLHDVSGKDISTHLGPSMAQDQP
ncbi:MAG: TrmH family RNA methyltransferase [Rhodothermia bacterium]|nr:TrmH family RNA methyltransferase [Rhodothermia bacterium]